jgi:hypothetical protein
MTLDTFAGLVAGHWVLMLLVLCPILIVLMALAALSCEACGAPFGIFRRRNRTIDLCLRCALLHDIRRAKETREAPSKERQRSNAEPASSPPQSGSSAEPKSPGRQEDRRQEDRRIGVATQHAAGLGIAGHGRHH